MQMAFYTVDFVLKGDPAHKVDTILVQADSATGAQKRASEMLPPAHIGKAAHYDYEGRLERLKQSREAGGAPRLATP